MFRLKNTFLVLIGIMGLAVILGYSNRESEVTYLDRTDIVETHISSIPIESDEESEQKEYSKYKQLFDESHYEATGSKGSAGLKEVTQLIEKSTNREKYLFKKLLAETYRLLAFDKSISSSSNRDEFKRKSRLIYRQLWTDYPYNKDVAEKLFDLLDDPSESQAFVIEVLKKDPENSSFLRALSYDYLSSGDLENSIFNLLKAYKNESNGFYKKMYGNELIDILESNQKFDQLKEFNTEFEAWKAQNR